MISVAEKVFLFKLEHALQQITVAQCISVLQTSGSKKYSSLPHTGKQ